MNETILQEETWKSIKGYEGWYEVSSFGRVRSCDRIITQWSQYGHNIERKLKGQIINPTDNGYGYQIVGLAVNRKKKNQYVHRLVAEAFLDNPDGKAEVNHKDANKKNNHISNLEWVTRQENMDCAVSHMCHPKNGRPTKTGEKYITIKRGRYRLNMGKYFDRRFRTLEEAVAMREVLLRDGKHYAR